MGSADSYLYPFLLTHICKKGYIDACIDNIIHCMYLFSDAINKVIAM